MGGVFDFFSGFVVAWHGVVRWLGAFFVSKWHYFFWELRWFLNRDGFFYGYLARLNLEWLAVVTSGYGRRKLLLITGIILGRSGGERLVTLGVIHGRVGGCRGSLGVPI